MVDDAFAIMNDDAKAEMLGLLNAKWDAVKTALGTPGNVTVGTKFGGLTAWPGGIFTPIQVKHDDGQNACMHPLSPGVPWLHASITSMHPVQILSDARLWLTQ
jgi:hypothetical protein